MLKTQIRPNKLLGQNFLMDKIALKKIIEAADLSKNDIVLEIGPGTGILTKELAQKVKKLIAVEKDPKMIEILREKFREDKNVEIIQGDILCIINPKLQAPNYKQIPNTKLKLPKKYKVVANIPYYLTSNLIRKFLEIENSPKKMVLTIQKEVAERICAEPPKMSLLAVSVQFYAKPEIVGYVSKKSFWPVPKVYSAIIKIEPRIEADKKQTYTDKFFKIVKAGFSQPRKQLLNNLKLLKLNKEEITNWLLKNRIDYSQRAETLTMQDWINLYNTF